LAKGCGRTWGNGIRCNVDIPNHEWCTGWDREVFSYVDSPNPDHTPPKTVDSKTAQSALESYAERVEPDPTSTGWEAALEGSEAAARTWTEAEKRMVREALHAVCQDHAGGGEFTTDAVWERLGASVPVTKGITSVLSYGKHHRWLDSTGKTEISTRGGKHDHAQRLTVWYSLLVRG
jgi:hypothetical protein